MTLWPDSEEPTWPWEAFPMWERLVPASVVLGASSVQAAWGLPWWVTVLGGVLGGAAFGLLAKVGARRPGLDPTPRPRERVFWGALLLAVVVVVPVLRWAPLLAGLGHYAVALALLHLLSRWDGRRRA